MLPVPPSIRKKSGMLKVSRQPRRMAGSPESGTTPFARSDASRMLEPYPK